MNSGLRWMDEASPQNLEARVRFRAPRQHRALSMRTELIFIKGEGCDDDIDNQQRKLWIVP